MSSLAWRNGRGSSREYSIEIDGKQIWFSQRVKSELIGFGTGGSVWNGLYFANVVSAHQLNDRSPFVIIVKEPSYCASIWKRSMEMATTEVNLKARQY